MHSNILQLARNRVLTPILLGLTSWATEQNLVSQRVEEVLMFITALFTRVSIWAQPMTDEWIKTNVHMHNGMLLSHLKN